MCLSDVEDKISQKWYPHDAPQDLLPRCVCGDGNCLCRTFSVVTFGTEHRHKEVWVRIAREAVLNSSIYLNLECLNRQSFSIPKSITIVELYALTLPIFNSMNREEQNLNTENCRKIYEKEVIRMVSDRTWMGMWQIHQFVNVIKWPIRIIHTLHQSVGSRDVFNQYMYPEGFTTRWGRNHDIYIMWTSSNNITFNIDHFVPLLKSK